MSLRSSPVHVLLLRGKDLGSSSSVVSLIVYISVSYCDLITFLLFPFFPKCVDEPIV
jgi:hypothetical protein